MLARVLSHVALKHPSTAAASLASMLALCAWTSEGRAQSEPTGPPVSLSSAAPTATEVTTASPAPTPTDTPTASAAPSASDAPAASAAPITPEDYRGRRRATPPGDALRWIPRVLLFPLYAVAEYALRIPVHAMVAGAEEVHAFGYVQRALHPVPNFSWYPTAVIDIGTMTSVGVHARWINAGHRANSLRGTLATGGAEFWLVDIEDRLQVDTLTFALRGYFITRPDRSYYGIGPATQEQDRTYYRLSRGEVHASMRWEPSTHATLLVDTLYRDEGTSDSSHDPALTTRFQPPPGFGHLQLLMLQAGLTLDSRHDRLGPTGVWMDLRGRGAIDPTNAQRSYVQAEFELQGAVEVLAPNRVLAGSVYVADTQPIGSEPIPFTSLIALGRERHQGYLHGRFIGESALLATAAWRWPVWDQLDAFVEGSVGNVFGRHFQGFDPGLFTASLGIGLRTRIDQATSFRAIVAVGSTQFNQPFDIEGVRFFASISPGVQ